MAVKYSNTTIADSEGDQDVDATYKQVERVSGDRYIALYAYTPDAATTDIELYLRLLDVNGNSIDLVGTATQLSTRGTAGDYPDGGASTYDLVMLSATSGIFVWVQSGNGKIYGRAISISGTTINVGSYTLIDSGSSNTCGVARVSDTRSIVAFDAEAVVVDVSGLTITPHTPQVVKSGVRGQIVEAPTGNALFYYIESTVLKAKILSNITTTFTVNSEYAFSASGEADAAATIETTGSRGLATYSDFTNGEYIQSFTISDTEIIVDNSIIVNPDDWSSYPPNVIPLDNTRGMLARNGGTSHLHTYLEDVDISTSTPSTSGQTDIEDGVNINTFDFALNDGDKVVLIYTWTDGADIVAAVVSSELEAESASAIFYYGINEPITANQEISP